MLADPVEKCRELAGGGAHADADENADTNADADAYADANAGQLGFRSGSVGSDNRGLCVAR